MEYSLNFTKQAFKELKEVNMPYYKNIKDAIHNLTINPRPYGYKKLKGTTAYRIKVSDYRIIYEIYDTIILIEIISIAHRKEVYKKK